MVDGRVVISERCLKELCVMILVLVFQDLVQYRDLVDMRVKIVCPLRAGHCFSDGLPRWGCVLTNGQTDSFCRKFCFIGLDCIFQLFPFLE
jgi:hypothetical protein